MNLDFKKLKARFPDFLVVGAAKSGTTSLFHYLNAHPDVFIPELKELWYLQVMKNPNKEILSRWSKIPTNLLSYSGMFLGAREDQVCGDMTPSYLMFPKYTIETINESLTEEQKKNLKIIIILREPIAKIKSHYRFNLKIGTEYLPFNKALELEKERIADNTLSIGFSYVQSTLYYEQVKAFLEAFDKVKVFLFDDLKDNPKHLMTDLYDFLNIDQIESVDLNKRYNTTDSVGGNNSLSSKIKRLAFYFPFMSSLPVKYQKAMYKRNYDRVSTELSPNNLKRVKKVFREDVLKLQELINRDLSKWLKEYE